MHHNIWSKRPAAAQFTLHFPVGHIYNLVAAHDHGQRAKNRAENSHQPVRRRERKQQRFKSPGSAQRFLSIHSATYNTFYHQRHLLKRSMCKELRTTSFEVWESASVAA